MELAWSGGDLFPGSMTLVGDIAQATGPLGAGDLGRRHGPPPGPAGLAPDQPFCKLPRPRRSNGTGRERPGGGLARGGATRTCTPDGTEAESPRPGRRQRR